MTFWRDSILSFLSICSVAIAIQTDWIGTYLDPTYGGNLVVCVSLVNGVYYGQGLVSDVGYLRGTIDSSNVWSGNYYLAGVEAERGTFSLTLSGDLSSYSGTYAQAGSTITYSVTSASRSSSATPTDQACFKSDDSMLGTSTFFNITGAYGNCDNGKCSPVYFGLTGSSTSTNSYTNNYADGVLYGVSHGSVFENGQVITDNWYESGSYTGIDLTVAKNSTYIYNLWWFVPSMASFNYSIKSSSYFGSGSITADPTVSIGEADRLAYSNICYALWTESAEESCLGNSITSTNDNNDDDSFDTEDRNLLITITAFVVMIFVMVFILLVMMFMNQTSKVPLSSQGSSQTVEMK